MDAKEQLTAALENTFQTQVGAVFTNFFSVLMTAGDDASAVRQAEDRLRTGLDLCKTVLSRATIIAGI